jgi:1-acyl-sn-glycerol-3-phosphate acyltransferase
VEGAPPKAPFFLVANHLGYIDVIVLSRVLGCTFIAKGDMESWPVFGWMMRNAQQLFIRREDFRDSSRAIGAIQETIRAGDGIVVFAEARCTSGADVAQFKPALLQAPVNLGLPVHYAALYYETPPGEPTASDTIVWWRWEPLQQQMGRMLRLSRGTARIRFGDAPVSGKDRKEVARAAYAGVCALFKPIEQGVLKELPAPDDLPKHLRG